VTFHVKQSDAQVEPAIVSPAEVRRVFGDRDGLAVRYLQHLATTGVERGLIGPREVPRLWERHVLNCAPLTSIIPSTCRVIDVGSGAGLPGIVLAIRRPDLRITLVEPLLRRSIWLREVCADLGLGSVSVHRGRAPEVSKTVRAPLVVARAVAPLPSLVACCLPLIQAGGSLLAIKGRTAAAELASLHDAFPAGVVATAEVLTLHAGSPGPPTTVVRVVRGSMDLPGADRNS
jgi:16S rRNA (guanine527-N7)-methyltransferase